MSKKKEISRRTVPDQKVAAGGAACAIVPRHVARSSAARRIRLKRRQASESAALGRQ